MGTLTIEKLIAFQVKVAAHFPNCEVALAGGAPRDLLNGAPVKDIDVFVWAPETDGWEEGCDSLAEAMHDKLVKSGKWSEDYAEARVHAVADLPNGLHFYPVQLIRTREPVVKSVEGFDFGLCQVYVMNGKLRMTKAYWKDHFNRTITLVNKQEQTNPKERYERMKAKYPQWKFTNCGHLA